jgi:Fic family protein
VTWNWQQPDWRAFTWDETLLRKAEDEFLRGVGLRAGALRHLPGGEQEQFAVVAMSTEALTTSEIEGEVLDRLSVQSSLRWQLGLATAHRSVRPAEQGVAEMVMSLCRTLNDPLSEEILFPCCRRTSAS